MIAQRLVKGLLSVCVIMVVVLVGRNMIAYVQETGFSSEKEMFSASLHRITSDRHLEDNEIVYQTGVEQLEETDQSYVVHISDFFDGILGFFSVATESLMVVMGFSMWTWTGIWQSVLHTRMDPALSGNLIAVPL